MTFNSSASLLEGRCVHCASGLHLHLCPFQRLFFCWRLPLPKIFVKKRTFFFLARLAGNKVGSFSPLSPMPGGGLSPIPPFVPTHPPPPSSNHHHDPPSFTFLKSFVHAPLGSFFFPRQFLFPWASPIAFRGLSQFIILFWVTKHQRHAGRRPQWRVQFGRMAHDVNLKQRCAMHVFDRQHRTQDQRCQMSPNVMQDCHKNTHTNGEGHHGFGLTEVVLLSSDGFAAPDGDGFLRRKEKRKRGVSIFAL